MTGYTFKFYIADGVEYFEYRESTIVESPLTKKDFPFPESLLKFLYLDIWKLEPLFQQMDRALLALYPSRDPQCAQEVLSALKELAPSHIYFELLCLDWTYRLERGAFLNYENAINLLPHKSLRQIPSEIDSLQKQILALFENVLNADRGKRSVQEKMSAYYDRAGGDTLLTYQFRPQPIRFERAGNAYFTDVLYPNTIYDLVGYALRECIRQEQQMRVCKNCGRWFALTGRSNTEYCDRPANERGQTCKDVGAIAKWNRARADDAVFKEYRREYKRRFAWIKAGRIEPEAFYVWSEKAREKKVECDNGTISLEEYQVWLKNS